MAVERGDAANNRSTNANLSPKSPAIGAIQGLRDSSDWYSFKGMAGGVYSFIAQGRGTFEPLIILRDSSGRDMDTSQYLGDGASELVDILLDASGIYYIDIRGQNSSKGAYRVNMREILPRLGAKPPKNIETPRLDLANNRSTKAVISSEAPAIGAIKGDRDTSDWFSFNASSNSLYTFTAIGRGLFDPLIILRNSAGVEIARTSMVEDNSSEIADVEIDTSGIYYLDVRSATGKKGSYRVEMTESKLEVSPTATPTAKPSIPADNAAPSDLSHESDPAPVTQPPITSPQASSSKPPLKIPSVGGIFGESDFLHGRIDNPSWIGPVSPKSFIKDELINGNFIQDYNYGELDIHIVKLSRNKKYDIRVKDALTGNPWMPIANIGYVGLSIQTQEEWKDDGNTKFNKLVWSYDQTGYRPQINTVGSFPWTSAGWDPRAESSKNPAASRRSTEEFEKLYNLCLGLGVNFGSLGPSKLLVEKGLASGVSFSFTPTLTGYYSIGVSANTNLITSTYVHGGDYVLAIN